MKVAFRADASLQIGTGHIMRCLTLADSLTTRGATCVFICRDHPGNLINLIKGKGYTTYCLPCKSSSATSVPPPLRLAHNHWLGAKQEEDADACASVLTLEQPDWLVVDHYALDAEWERRLAPYFRRLLVIDDLADRSHICDALLDQTFGRSSQAYRSLVPADCHVLCGSEFALLRPEFQALRSYSLRRRNTPPFRELLITLGGVDKDNATRQVLQALWTCALPADCRITVVMGETAPWLDDVTDHCRHMPWMTRVLTAVNNMAQLMADSDFAIGAAGATSWERCCLGLPTAMLVLADNQRFAARLLAQARVVRMLDLTENFQNDLSQMIREMSSSKASLAALSDTASGVTDGNGAMRVTDWLMGNIQ